MRRSTQSLFLHGQSTRPGSESSLLQPLNLGIDFVLVKGDFVGLAALGPEIGHGEARIEVDAEVVHEADGEHDVHAELERERSMLVNAWLLACVLKWVSNWLAYFEDFEIGTAHVCDSDLAKIQYKWMQWKGRGHMYVHVYAMMMGTGIDDDCTKRRAEVGRVLSGHHMKPNTLENDAQESIIVTLP